MDFFNSLIKDTNNLLTNYSCKAFEYNSNNAWEDLGYNQVILQRDTAFELDGVGFNLVTSSPIADEILVVGDDCADISQKRKFTRVSIVEIDAVDDEQKAYNLIRKIEYVKYHNNDLNIIIEYKLISQENPLKIEINIGDEINEI